MLCYKVVSSVNEMQKNSIKTYPAKSVNVFKNVSTPKSSLLLCHQGVLSHSSRLNFVNCCKSSQPCKLLYHPNPVNFLIIPTQGVHGVQASQGGLEASNYCCNSPSRWFSLLCLGINNSFEKLCHLCSDNCQCSHHQLLEEKKKKSKRHCIRGG